MAAPEIDPAVQRCADFSEEARCRRYATHPLHLSRHAARLREELERYRLSRRYRWDGKRWTRHDDL